MTGFALERILFEGEAARVFTESLRARIGMSVPCLLPADVWRLFGCVGVVGLRVWTALRMQQAIGIVVDRIRASTTSC